MKLYKWMYQFSKKKLEQRYLKKYHNTVKCPNCKKWTHEKHTDGQHDHTVIVEWGYSLTCGNCDYISYWNCVAFPFPCLANTDGDPLVVNKNKPWGVYD